MSELSGLAPERVFKYFEEICAIPHGSENMEEISAYCMRFAEEHSLKAIRDDANNVVIFKEASSGYENCQPVILQGHLDMVCQSDGSRTVDFEKDGIIPTVKDGYVTAVGTSLGADNGIALAMILAVLESDKYSHPPIEAVFTVDEEIGMIGAGKLNTDILKSKRMINIDSEEDDTVTVSCAGGSDIRVTVGTDRIHAEGYPVTLVLKGLYGGHSGVEINSGRVNADILAGRILNHIRNLQEFEVVAIDGGDKGNAIPNRCTVKLLCKNNESFTESISSYLEVVKNEISDKEPLFDWEISGGEYSSAEVFGKEIKNKLIYCLVSAPNGVMEMSAGIEGLVETSLNLGILSTDDDKITLHFTLRSNKMSALLALEERMLTFLGVLNGSVEAFGYYPAWEYKEDSQLRKVYTECYTAQNNMAPKVAAIHAGLECGLFSSKIEGLDCISMGPDMRDVHTVNERLYIESTERTFNLLLNILKDLKK